MTKLHETFKSIVVNTLVTVTEEVKRLGTDRLDLQVATLKRVITEVSGALNVLEELLIMVEEERVPFAEAIDDYQRWAELTKEVESENVVETELEELLEKLEGATKVSVRFKDGDSLVSDEVGEIRITTVSGETTIISCNRLATLTEGIDIPF